MGRVAVVTGGTRGIGAVVCKSLKDEGCPVAPGSVDTDMVRAMPPNVLEKIVQRISVGRLGRAEDIARGVLFLVSDDADFITGSTLSINGGQHMD